jgi:hypothetical protein
MGTDSYEDIGSTQRNLSSPVSPGGVAYWGDNPELYDTVELAGLKLPGLCSVKGKGYEMRRKQHKPPGKHGVSTTIIAHEPAEFVINVLMTTKAHLDTFKALVPVFKPTAKPKEDKKKDKSDAFTHAFKGQASKAADGTITLPTLTIRTEAVAAAEDNSQPKYVTVDHPLLALFRISHCRIIKVTIPEQVEDKGMWKSEIHCIEEVLEGNRKAKTGKTGSGNLLTIKTAQDKLLNRVPESPSKSNVGPP